MVPTKIGHNLKNIVVPLNLSFVKHDITEKYSQSAATGNFLESFYCKIQAWSLACTQVKSN